MSLVLVFLVVLSGGETAAHWPNNDMLPEACPGIVTPLRPLQDSDLCACASFIAPVGT